MFRCALMFEKFKKIGESVEKLKNFRGKPILL